MSKENMAVVRTVKGTKIKIATSGDGYYTIETKDLDFLLTHNNELETKVADLEKEVYDNLIMYHHEVSVMEGRIEVLLDKVAELEKVLDDMISEHNDLKQDAYDAKKACRIMEMETGLHRERADKAEKANAELKNQLAQLQADPRGFFK